MDLAYFLGSKSRIQERKIMLDKKAKDKIIKKFRTHESDTGSPQVQIAILSAEIEELVNHLKEHRHDYSSRRGLLKKVAERRRLLKYLQKENEVAFKDLAEKLKLKIAKKLQEEEEKKAEKEKVFDSALVDDEIEELEK